MQIYSDVSSNKRNKTSVDRLSIMVKLHTLVICWLEHFPNYTVGVCTHIFFAKDIDTRKLYKTMCFPRSNVDVFHDVLNIIE